MPHAFLACLGQGGNSDVETAPCVHRPYARAVLLVYLCVCVYVCVCVCVCRPCCRYGGIFIFMSYMWGWALDGDRPDTGDYVGSAIAVAGVLAAWFWPRG